MPPEPRDVELYSEIKESVKARVRSWPSAYASAQLVQTYVNAYKHKHGARSSPYKDAPRKSGNLARWFQEKWVDLCRPGNPPCGRKTMDGTYPYCRPSVRVSKDTPMTMDEMTAKFGKAKLQAMCKKKQKSGSKRISV